MSEKIKILTTDSGLGGLSLTAELVEAIRREKRFKEVEIIFFNCRPSAESGYDQLGNNEARSRVFSRALDAMYEKFRPDVIMLACNTLSAIYGMTEFSKAPPVPVTGIIESGVDEIFNLLNAKPEMQMIMFATSATVSSGVHKNILTARGIAPERLHYQACQNLPSEIMLGPESDKVKNMIESFMESVAAKVKGKPFGISLLCTHFAYSVPVFSGCARKFENFSGDVISPDSAMVASFLKNHVSDGAGKTNISVKCRTHTTISPQTRQAVFPLLKRISPDTERAFREMLDTPDMFKI